jgi:hypothetical protein
MHEDNKESRHALSSSAHGFSGKKVEDGSQYG